MRRIVLVLFCALLVCAVPAARETSQQAPPVFRSGIQYVAVDVVVTDKNDKPITDLRKDEFEITESGRPQKIADFQFVSVPAVTRTVVANTVAEPEPDVATNAAPSPNSRLFVMLIDDLHLIEQNIIPIKAALNDTLNAISPDDDVAIVFVSHSDMSVNFTRNRAKLQHAIDNVRGALGFGLDSLAHSPDGAATATAKDQLNSSTSPSKWRFDYARSAFMTLGSVSKALAGSTHSRRAILFFTGGSTLDPWDPNNPLYYDPNYYEELKVAVADAHRANVPVYTIDPRGNITPDDAVRGAALTERTRQQVRRNLKTQRDNLSEIAVNTGGRAIVGASDMKRMVQEIVAENSSFYLLGYYPEPLVSDGKFHELKVHTTRPGAIVRARSGYVAPSKERAAATTAEVMDKAMASGVNVSGLEMRVVAAPIAAAKKGMTTAVTVELKYPAPIDGSRRIDDSIELSIVALDPDAKVETKTARTFKLAGSVPSSGDIVLLFNEVVDLPSQSLVLRVGTASQALGKAGTAQINLDVQKPSDSKLQIGGVAIGVDATGRASLMNGDLVKPLLPFQPTTTREFAASDTLKIYSRLFWKNKEQPSVKLTVTGASAPMSVAPDLAVTTVDGRQEGVLTANLPLKSLAPGRYYLMIEAQLAKQLVNRVIPFEVK